MTAVGLLVLGWAIIFLILFAALRHFGRSDDYRREQ
jgi:hypothetical protein